MGLCQGWDGSVPRSFLHDQCHKPCLWHGTRHLLPTKIDWVPHSPSSLISWCLGNPGDTYHLPIKIGNGQKVKKDRKELTINEVTLTLRNAASFQREFGRAFFERNSLFRVSWSSPALLSIHALFSLSMAKDEAPEEALYLIIKLNTSVTAWTEHILYGDGVYNMYINIHVSACVCEQCDLPLNYIMSVHFFTLDLFSVFCYGDPLALQLPISIHPVCPSSPSSQQSMHHAQPCNPKLLFPHMAGAPAHWQGLRWRPSAHRFSLLVVTIHDYPNMSL